MCNDYGIDIPFRLFVEAFEALGMPLDVSGGIPNLEPRDEIWPTERAPVIRLSEAGTRMDMLTWGLPPSRPKAPVVINMRSEGRRFERRRCLIPASHFYEFAGTKSPKTRWRFTKTGEDWFCIAGITGADGSSFSMLTVPPGPDIAPIHNRQIVVLERTDWRAWLEGGAAPTALLTPSAEGTFTVAQAPRPTPVTLPLG